MARSRHRSGRHPARWPMALGLLAAAVRAAPSDSTDVPFAVPERQLAQATVAPALGFYSDMQAATGRRQRRELAGLIVNGREQPDGVALLRQADGGRFLPLGELAPLLGARLVKERDAWVLETPLGPARFALEELLRFGDESFAGLELAGERLAAQVRFDESQYALVVRLLWDPSPRPGRVPEEPIRPDLDAPAFSLSRMRGEIGTQRDSHDSRESGFAEFDGRLGAGTWRFRAETDFDGDLYARDYTWKTVAAPYGVLLGHQVVGAHSLFPSFDLTGAQVAYSNAAQRLLAPLDPGRLTEDRAGPVRDLRGEGPPGGIAELLIDGIPQARTRIPLDGLFEFPAVELSAGYVRIEVALYEPTALGAPVDVLDFSGQASDRLLPGGASLVHAGGGQEGNPLDDRHPSEGDAGFVRARYGVSERLTVEGAWQRSAAGDYAAAGAAVNAGAVGVLALSAAQSDGESAWLANLEGGTGSAFWRASAREYDAGYRSGSDGRSIDRYAEAGWRHWPRWEISLIGRERRMDGTDVSFVKPAARLRPWTGLSLQARPDADGEYVFDAAWRWRRDTRFTLRRDQRSEMAQFDHDLSRSFRLTGSVLHDRPLGRTRSALLGSYQPAGDWYVDAGVLNAGGETGFLARAGIEFLPGIRARLEARRDPLELGGGTLDGGAFGTGASAGTVVWASLAWDLGRAGRGFTRAGGVARAATGSVGGRIGVSGAASAASLEGVAIRVDGQARGRTDAAGRFNLAGLAPGVHRVELDEEGLPLEFSPEDTGYWVEVAAGATTPVEFRVALRLGAAGRLLRSDDTPAEAGSVQAIDAEGRVRARGAATAFGYYRIDGLPPGIYRLRWLDPEGHPVAERELLLSDGFLFGQDVRAPAASTIPQHATDEVRHDERK